MTTRQHLALPPDDSAAVAADAAEAIREMPVTVPLVRPRPPPPLPLQPTTSMQRFRAPYRAAVAAVATDGAPGESFVSQCWIQVVRHSKG